MKQTDEKTHLHRGGCCASEWRGTLSTRVSNSGLSPRGLSEGQWQKGDPTRSHLGRGRDWRLGNLLRLAFEARGEASSCRSEDALGAKESGVATSLSRSRQCLAFAARKWGCRGVAASSHRPAFEARERGVWRGVATLSRHGA